MRPAPVGGSKEKFDQEHSWLEIKDGAAEELPPWLSRDKPPAHRFRGQHRWGVVATWLLHLDQSS